MGFAWSSGLPGRRARERQEPLHPLAVGPSDRLRPETMPSHFRQITDLSVTSACFATRVLVLLAVACGGCTRMTSWVVGLPTALLRLVRTAARAACTRTFEDRPFGVSRPSLDGRSVYPLDLCAAFPDAFRFKPSGASAPGFLSWGCQKNASPPHSTVESTPGSRCRHREPSGRRCQAPTMFRPRGSSPPRRLAPPRS